MPSRTEVYTAANGYRAVQFGPDFRKAPKTTHYCSRCQKDIEPGRPTAMVYVTDKSMAECCHPEDLDLLVPTLKSNESHGWVEVGSECARRFGKDFTRGVDEVRAAGGRLFT